MVQSSKAAEFTPPAKGGQSNPCPHTVRRSPSRPNVLELTKRIFIRTKNSGANLANTQLGISKKHPGGSFSRNCTIDPDARAEDLGLWVGKNYIARCKKYLQLTRFNIKNKLAFFDTSVKTR